jgi:TonB family protein
MLLLAMAAALSAPLPRDRASWITDNDYPRSASAAGEQGQVTVALTVDESGEPQVCAVRSTTAPASLARLSCSLIVQRAHFQPARDDRGKPVAGEFVQTVQWALPSPGTLADSGYVTHFDIDEAGNIAGCSVAGVGGQRLDSQTASMCNQLRNDRTLAMFVKKPLDRIKSVELRFLIKVDRPAGTITVSPPSHDFHRVISTAELDFLDGNASHCATGLSETIAGSLVDACEMLGLKAARSSRDGDAARTTHGTAIFDVVGSYR